jgi:uncharacterized protein
MNSASIVATTLADVTLEEDPINPEWIIHGAPVARCGQWSASTRSSAATCPPR